MAHEGVNKNPLSVTTPEDLLPKEAVDLFVDYLGDYPKILREGHIFLQGPRGSGKSMIFRYALPDCQCIVHNCVLQKLPFYSLYVPLRNTEVRLTELLMLDRHHASAILNEHFLIIFIAVKIFIQIARDTASIEGEAYLLETKEYAKEFFRLFRECGWNETEPNIDDIHEPHKVFEVISGICEQSLRSINQYIKRLFIPAEMPSYKGPLCGYIDFLLPVLRGIKNLAFTPEGPIFLLIDDADNLNLSQTKVLNTWVSSRTSGQVSLKISNQLMYKTYITLRGNTIDTPHDYSEVNISPIYTASKRNRYKDRVHEIVRKRLELYGIDAIPEEFFPEDKKQEDAIKAIASKYLQDWEKTGRGYRPNDDAIRYSRPDYMKSLKGKSKSGPSYSYAGFEQLVHISSGVVRCFLEPAALMFGDVLARNISDGNPNLPVNSIPPGTQNKIIKDEADNFLFGEMEKMLQDQSSESPQNDDLTKLLNLIQALGGTFQHILLSDRSERRIFSIAFSNNPDEEIMRILRLGIHLSYFQKSTIGNKDGTGRTPLYILNRRLAPHFYLDPTSFAGYLFVTRDAIRKAMYNPNALLRKVNEDIDGVFQTQQADFSEVGGDEWL